MIIVFEWAIALAGAPGVVLDCDCAIETFAPLVLCVPLVDVEVIAGLSFAHGQPILAEIILDHPFQERVVDDICLKVLMLRREVAVLDTNLDIGGLGDVTYAGRWRGLWRWRGW